MGILMYFMIPIMRHNSLTNTKKKSVAKLIHIKGSLELYDIWLVRNSKKNDLHFDRDIIPVSFRED